MKKRLFFTKEIDCGILTFSEFAHPTDWPGTDKVSKFLDSEGRGVSEFQIMKLKTWNVPNLVENITCLVSFRPDYGVRTEYSIKIYR